MSLIVSGGEDPSSAAVSDTKVQGVAADNAAASGNPLLNGGVVDETTPSARDEGDAVPNRMSAEGDQMVQPAFEGATIADANGEYVQGSIAHDAVDAGNPIKIGGKATNDISSKSDVAVNDRVEGAFTLKGAQIIAGASAGADALSNQFVRWLDDTDTERILGAGLYALAPDNSSDRLRTLGDTTSLGIGVLAVGARVPGASEVKTLIVAIGATSAARATFLTPSSGKKVRVLSFRTSAQNLTTDPDEVQVYFGTGAAVTTNAASIIGVYDTGTDGTDGEAFGEEGPVGAADEVVSWRTETETETGLLGVIRYREE